MQQRPLTHALGRIALGASLALPLSAFAVPGYWTDSAGQLVHTGNGECVRTGTWKPADANSSCDADLMPKPAPAPAPMPTAMPAPKPAPVMPPPPPAPKIITLNEQASGKAHLGFNKYKITPAQQKLLDAQLKSVDPNSVQSVVVTGYTDRIGSKAYNMKLSQKRAQSVASYIEQRYSIPAEKMTVVGKGPADPVATCTGVKGRAALIKCLAPNRRVTVAISWMHKVVQHPEGTMTAPQQ
ncbi:OmpA family protein [Acidihalobacter prosperus]|uniref:OmpA-like domain-containing protein n=1 Tax=Acidihalobacter prosperus TaxID=160660 RepID=A0A1A6C6D5_9GAMM|nr:OmpA family protein [Acidihalobacter prosperus]OBS10128.1 hypothetical protein Thpro_021178 [Acidihalobacter prosperus]